MLTTHDVYWLAGLLEGEGCFTSAASKSPVLQVSMTDRDVVERAARLLTTKTAPKAGNGRHRQQWKAGVYGNRAAGWMMTLYPLLGVRRRKRIRQVLALWGTYTAHQRDREFCKNGHRLSGDNVLAAQWTDSKGVVHKKARRCRICFNRYVKDWRAKKPVGSQAIEARERRRLKAEREGRLFNPRHRR